MDIEAIRERWKRIKPLDGALTKQDTDALFAEVVRLEAQAKHLEKSQHELFYALDSALRIIGVGYNSGAAVNLREQHRQLVTHRADCDGCTALAAYAASQKEQP